MSMVAPTAEPWTPFAGEPERPLRSGNYSVSKLEAKLEKWRGHKRRIQGTIKDIRHVDSSPSDDYILLEIWVEDDTGKMLTYFRMPRGNLLPTTGSEIVAIGQVEPDFRIRETYFVIEDVKILKAGRMFAIVEDQ